jgi:hypothetical protein
VLAVDDRVGETVAQPDSAPTVSVNGSENGGAPAVETGVDPRSDD